MKKETVTAADKHHSPTYAGIPDRICAFFLTITGEHPFGKEPITL